MPTATQAQLPIALDAVTLKRLVVVRRIYEHALIDSASSFGAVERIMAVIGFDLAIETLLKAVVLAVDPMKDPPDQWNALLQSAGTFLGKCGVELPLLGPVKHVHALRNDAQHKAKYPSAQEVEDCRTYTRDFSEATLALLWNRGIEQLREADLVQNEKVRNFLSKAEEQFEASEYDQTVQQAAAGLELALLLVKSATVGRVGNFNAAFMVVDSFHKPKEDAEVFKSFEMVRDVALHYVLGLDYSRYMRFKEATGRVVFAIGGKPHWYNTPKDPSRSQAEFILAYAINTVLEIENRVGNLDVPWGKKHW